MPATITTTASDRALERWLGPLLDAVPALSVVDAHTHLGDQDPDGRRCVDADLHSALAPLDARAVVFPMHEPSGYRRANDAILAATERSNGQLIPFCRVDPHSDAVPEAERAIAAGVRGIKLHPRAEQFDLRHPAVAELVELAAAHRLPVLFHAGRGIPPLGADALALARAHPQATIILAHAAVTDLSWIWREITTVENVYLDTAWWNGADLLAMFALVPADRILFASDMPYGSPTLAAILALRCALTAGLDDDQIASVMGGQLTRILDDAPARRLGAAPAGLGAPRDVVLERVAVYLAATYGRVTADADPGEVLALARMSLQTAGTARHARVCAAIEEILELDAIEPAGMGAIALAATVALTPDVPLPA